MPLPKVTIAIRVDVGNCLFGFAAVLYGLAAILQLLL